MRGAGPKMAAEGAGPKMAAGGGPYNGGRAAAARQR